MHFLRFYLCLALTIGLAAAQNSILTVGDPAQKGGLNVYLLEKSQKVEFKLWSNKVGNAQKVALSKKQWAQLKTIYTKARKAAGSLKVGKSSHAGQVGQLGFYSYHDPDHGRLVRIVAGDSFDSDHAIDLPKWAHSGWESMSDMTDRFFK